MLEEQKYITELTLYAEPSYFIVKMKQEERTLIIDKIKKSVEVKASFDKTGEGVPILGILGVVEAPVTNYLALITKASLVGNILKSRIFKVEEVKFLPYVNSIDVQEEDMKYINMYQSFLNRNTLYFSDKYDLTNSSKRYFSSISKQQKSKSIFQNLNVNYCWNYNLFKSLAIPEAEGIVFPVINGFVSIKSIECYQKEFKFILISRKDDRRAGVRYIVRGADHNGCTANFVETEQLLTYVEDGSQNIISYLIIRGSIPLIWNQTRTLAYNPIVKLN
jgi:hypothetical protein